MAFYECVFIARQDITAAQVEALTETFSQIVRDGGGQVPKAEQWGLKSLTFKIAKNRKGHYVLLNLDCTPAAKEELERNLGLHEDVLRHLTVRVDALDPGQSAMLQNRGERTERGGDRGERGDRPDRGDRPRRFEGDRGDRPDRGPRPPRRVEGEAEGAAQ